jgi:hypothetical protein
MGAFLGLSGLSARAEDRPACRDLCVYVIQHLSDVAEETTLLDCDTSVDTCKGTMSLQLSDRRVAAQIFATHGYPGFTIRIKSGGLVFSTAQNAMVDIRAPLSGESPTYRLYAVPENWQKDSLIVRRGEKLPGFLTVKVERH